MPMKVNMHELAEFVELCADLDADRFVLRPLNEIPDELDWTLAGHHFVYSQERLDFDTLVRLSARAAALCRLRQVPFSNLLDFGGEMEPIFQQAFDEALREAGETSAATGRPDRLRTLASAMQPSEPEPTRPIAIEAETETLLKDGDATFGESAMPACLEPWKSLYILRRGVLPCCYGHRPLATMGKYRDIWNAPILKDIRRHIARCEFHSYCLDSPSCPIVRKARHAPMAVALTGPRRRRPMQIELVIQAAHQAFAQGD